MKSAQITQTKYFSTCENPTITEYKNTIIIIFLTLIVLSLLGVNICNISTGAVDFVTDIFAPIFRNVLDMFGYSFGSALKHTADDITDGAKVGVEVVGGSVSDVGDIIMEQTKKEGFINLDAFLNASPYSQTNPETLVSVDPLQK
jgi:hypothetical protein